MLRAMSGLTELARRLQGPPLALPRLLDGLSERWWALTPRMRMVLVVLMVAALLGGAQWRVADAQRRWGGPPRRVLIAARDTAAGQTPQLRVARLPPALVPPDAPQRVDGEVRLALALPQGAVLTRAHLSPRGPAAGLDRDLRVVPIPVEPGWDVRAGSWVDVWVLAAQPAGSTLIARRRPVVAVGPSDTDDRTALVGLAAPEVAAAMRGLVEGQVLLTQAPP
jgi:hypothetical protein